MDYWTMRDGSKIRVKDMADSHLINSLKMMRRNASKAISAVTSSMLALSCGFQGEEASYQIDREICEMDRLMESPDEFLERNDSYKALIREFKRRKLVANLGEVI